MKDSFNEINDLKITIQPKLFDAYPIADDIQDMEDWLFTLSNNEYENIREVSFRVLNNPSATKKDITTISPLVLILYYVETGKLTLTSTMLDELIRSFCLNVELFDMWKDKLITVSGRFKLIDNNQEYSLTEEGQEYSKNLISNTN